VGREDDLFGGLTVLDRFGREYGAGPLHLALALASLVVAGWVALQIHGFGTGTAVAVWLFGAILAHDLVLLPLYSLAGLLAARATGAHRSGRGGAGTPAPAALLRLNHVRVPVLISALLFVLFFPSILGLSDGFEGTSGQSADPYLGRWLALSALLFAGSGLLYAVRRRRAARARPEPPAEAATLGG
jgi:hypothetical protein